MNEQEAIKELIFNGYNVEYKHTCICDLRGHLPHRMHHSRVYQVHSGNFSQIYSDLDQAVNKFISLKKKRK